MPECRHSHLGTRRRQFLNLNLAWLSALRRCIDENDQAASARRLCQFRSKLLGPDDLDIAPRKLLLQPIRNTESHSIIRPQRISIRDDEDSGHI